MVPFAVIGMLVLLSAVALVGSVHVQQPPEVDTDRTTAVERTEVAAPTALEDAVVEATTQAAGQPLTATANTSFGHELEGRAATEDDVFHQYVRALIAMEAKATLPSAGQEVGAVSTTLSTPAIDDADSFGAAIDRISIRESDDGLLTVELADVEMQTTAHGEEIEKDTKTISVTVNSPVFELHDRTETFQGKLDASLHESGFSQRFTAQVYALGWARGYAQYGGAPITEVVANRHLEPMTNQALANTQRDVFGEADPKLGNALRQGWFCMATQDAEGLYEGYSNTEVDMTEDVCSGSEWLFGDSQTGELPDAPETTDLLGAAPGMDAKHTIGVNETAYLPFRTLVTGDGTHSIDSALDRALTVETEIDSAVEAESLSFDHDRPNESAVVDESSREHVQTSVDATSIDSVFDGDRIRLSDITGSITVREEKIWHWNSSNETVHSASTTETATARFTMSLDIVAEKLAPDSLAPQLSDEDILAGDEPIELSESSSTSSIFATTDELGEAILIEIAGESSDTAISDWLETEIDSPTATADLSVRTGGSLSLTDQVSTEFQKTVLDNLRALQSDTETVSHTFERSELVQANSEDSAGPIAGLQEQVRDKQQQRIEGEQSKETLVGLVRSEVTHSYFELLLDDLETIEDGHTEAIDGLDEPLEDIDGGLDKGLAALQEGISPDEPEPVPFETSGGSEDIQYEIHGSPTYLTTETATADDVPQIGHTDKFASLSLKNDNQLQMPYEAATDGLFDRFASFVGFAEPDAELSLQMAGETLRAGELATAAAADDGYGSHEKLESGTESIRTETDAAIEAFTRQFTETLVYTLYPEEIQVGQGTGDNAEVPEMCLDSGVHCLIPDDSKAATAQQEIQSALEAELAEYDSVGERAIAIGDGELIEPLTHRLPATLSESQYRPASIDSSQAWEGTVESSVYLAFTTATQEQTVAMDNIDELEVLDEHIRDALSEVSSDIVEERLASTVEDEFAIDKYDDWVDGVDTPIRVPAGVPLLPVPGMWYATVNAWDIRAYGEYSRFEVRANLTTTDDRSSLTYVRENATVTTAVGGEERRLGSVEPLSFDEQTTLIVVVPPGGIGVGDRTSDNPECSPMYPHTGAISGQENDCG